MKSQSSTHSLRKTRKDHATEIAEDYVELIAELIQIQGTCRVTELARRMGVSHVTASRTVGRLVTAGLAETRPHHPIDPHHHHASQRSGPCPSPQQPDPEAKQAG